MSISKFTLVYKGKFIFNPLSGVNTRLSRPWRQKRISN